MKRRMHRWALAVLVTLAAGVSSAHAASTVVLPRAGQVGLGMQVQAGTLLKSGGLGEEFGSGPGLAVRLRYRMRFERALGLSFDVQRLKSRDPSARDGAFDSLVAVPGTPQLLRERIKVVTAGIEFYQLFDTRERTVKMLSAGAGLAQVSAKLNDGQTQFPLAGDGVYLSLGAGLERFAYRSLAWDLSLRYMTVLHDKKVNHDVQLALGFIFYAAY
jgi:hypothetical protein